WITVMYLTPPESQETLERFYRKVRPGGPGWRQVRERTGIPTAQSLKIDILRVLAATLVLFGLMFSIGSFLLLRPLWGTVLVAVAVTGWLWLRSLNAHAYAARVG